MIVHIFVFNLRRIICFFIKQFVFLIITSIKFINYFNYKLNLQISISILLSLCVMLYNISILVIQKKIHQLLFLNVHILLLKVFYKI